MNKDSKIPEDKTRAYSIPYLPLDNYLIDKELIEAVPLDIVKKYHVIPVDKLGENISVVMEDPFNEDAIKAIEKITGCKVRKLLGTHEEIDLAIEKHYSPSQEAAETQKPEKEKTEETPAKRPAAAKIKTEEKSYDAKTTTTAKQDVEEEDKKAEKRQFYRFKCTTSISFPIEGAYYKSETVDISYNGISFKSKKPLAVGSYLIVKLEPFKRTYDYPIIMLVQVIRRTQFDESNFCIGARILKTTKENIRQIIDYAKANLAKAHVAYEWIERRKYPRYEARINLWFPDKDNYSKTETVDVSCAGLLFKTGHRLSVGSYLPLQMELPKSVCPYPLALLVQVARIVHLKDGNFHIGGKIINIGDNEIEDLIKYASRVPR